MSTKKGWECPKCKAVYAPWVPSCGNCPDGGTYRSAGTATEERFNVVRGLRSGGATTERGGA
jgi:hypothetical protein